MMGISLEPQPTKPVVKVPFSSSCFAVCVFASLPVGLIWLLIALNALAVLHDQLAFLLRFVC